MRSAALLGFALALAFAPAAHANGRDPVTNGVFFQATDNQTIYVSTTFGLLISRDGGSSFRWTCERNIGYDGEYDPHFAVADDGTLFATTFDGLRVSRDGGCSFTTATAELPEGAPGRIADLWVDGLDIGPTGDVWVGTANNAAPNDVFRSTDGGATFAASGLRSPVYWYNTIAVARGDKDRVYASAYELGAAPAAHLFSTTNGGMTWTEPALTGVEFAAGVRKLKVAAVDRDDPERLFLVSIKANGTGDILYRSDDGGETCERVLATTQPISNVVIRDATTVLVASADMLARIPGGLYRSDDGGATFGGASAAMSLIGCLGTRPDGSLVACGPNWDPDFMAVGRSDDGAQWQKIFRFGELVGPLACPAGTAAHDICEAQEWCDRQKKFTLNDPRCPEPEIERESGGCCGAGSAGAPFGFGVLTVLTALLLVRRRRA